MSHNRAIAERIADALAESGMFSKSYVSIPSDFVSVIEKELVREEQMEQMEKNYDSAPPLAVSAEYDAEAVGIVTAYGGVEWLEQLEGGTFLFVSRWTQEQLDKAKERAKRLTICVCAQGVRKCPKHGDQPAKRETCPECKKSVLAYCAAGEYCTSETCKYVS